MRWRQSGKLTYGLVSPPRLPRKWPSGGSASDQTLAREVEGWTVKETKPQRDRHRRALLRRVTKQAIRQLPPDGNLQGWVDNLERLHGKPVTIVQYDNDDSVDLSGTWIGKADCDYILIDSAATPARTAMILAHEVAHMMLNHRGLDDDIPDSVLAILAPDFAPEDARRHLSSHDVQVLGRHNNYDEATESEAEEMATALAAAARQRQRMAHYRDDPVSARLR